MSSRRYGEILVSLMDPEIALEKQHFLNATFRRIMTNVPGFIPKPYPIVIFPGTFVIILEKAAVDFFFVSWKKNPTKMFAEFLFSGVEK